MRAGLIGRGHPAGVLRAEIGRATASHGGLVLVTGEAGIGKTTLVTDAMEVAREQGALVLSGSCWDSDAAPGFWPWVQVVRGLRRQTTAEEWAAVEEAAGGQLAVLLGESGDPADGFGMYDAVTSALVAMSQRRPVLVVLDDLHWADPSSVRLLEFVAQHTWFERLLLVGTYRDVEVEATEHPLAPLVLPLLTKATTVTLTGLDRDEVGALMTRTVGIAPTSDLVAEVHLRTGGNPFFVEQTVRLWYSGGSVTDVAPGVRDAVRRRLSLLPEPVSRLLSSAAVLGREFHRQVLAASVGEPVAHVDRHLGQAVAARLVSTLGDGRFAFAHDLVRETLYLGLGDAVAGERHAAVVRALDSSPALAGRIFPADLARHAYLGRASLEPRQVVDVLVVAAKDARRRSAYEESANHYRRAVALLSPTDPRRARIALDFGVQLHNLGERDEAWRVLEEVAGAALSGDDLDVLVRSALTLYGLASAEDREKLKEDLLRAAYARLNPGSAPPAGSLDHLAQEVIVRLIAIARDDGDDEVLEFSLWTQHDRLWGMGHAAQRLALTDELATIARRTGDREMEQYAVSLGWVATFELNDPSYHERFRAFLALVAEPPRTQVSDMCHIDRNIIATLHGRFDEAAAHLATAREGELPDGFSHVDHHLEWAMWLLQGRFEDLGDVRARATEVKHPLPTLLEGITAACRGEAATARECLAELESRRDPQSGAYEPLMTRLRVQVAVATGDVDRCATLHDELVPHEGTWLVSLYGCDLSGPVTLWLGHLSLTRGDTRSATRYFEAARKSADLMGARPWSVEAKAGLAAALTGAPAAELRAQVAREAASLGMRHLASDVEPLPHNEFRCTGETWSLSMAGRTVHVPDSKGLRDLHVLLRAPGKEIPATRLLNPSGGETVTATGGDPLLDEEARTRYRARLSTLDELIEEADTAGEDQKAAAYDREREALLTELRTATGLGGRTRRLGDEAERARKTVTARIRDTLRKLDTSHPELATHLRATVTTGTTCAYHPEVGITWQS
ncbi:ATP-binding protein [Actinophytocola oryzae]|uniref:AAA ATPase-like protein n=1 Tax=Actinophytocola oryzae TaxID=502181 RepID=A0A4R7VVC3_9PSEU|nr:AAA family ATPase [Actinophytocola oryzae]TDV53812.1 AAA ATPase-like protein [Actinophytocola oryzae]